MYATYDRYFKPYIVPGMAMNSTLDTASRHRYECGARYQKEMKNCSILIAEIKATKCESQFCFRQCESIEN